MQYFIGFIFAVSLIYIVATLQQKYNIFAEFVAKEFMPSQSKNHQIKFLFNIYDSRKSVKKIEKKSQSKIHEEKTNIKVIIMDEQAYWIKDNIFYTANMSGNNVDKDTTRRVDTMTMNKVQLDKMIFIIDCLREEASDDSGGTRY